MSAPDDALLRRLPFFRRVSSQLRARVAQAAHLKSYQKGELIFAEGDPCDTFFVIVSGRVKLFKSTPAGKQIILYIFGAGDPLGAISVYEHAPFMVSALSLEPTEVLSIGQAEFFHLLSAEPAVVRGLLSGLTQRLVELTGRLTELTGARVETRFARLFLNLSDQIGRPERGGVFIPLVLSRQELADLTGTTIETAIRIMSRWHRDDLLHTEKDGFVVIDRSALDSAAAG